MTATTARVGPAARKAVWLLVLAVVASVAPARPATPLGPFCDKNNPPPNVAGQGTKSHQALFYGLWLPSYTDACKQATGRVAYYGTSDEYASRAMLRREADFVGRDVAFTPVEQAFVQSDTISPEGDYVALRGRTNTVLHIPMFMSALSVVFRLPCGSASDTLKLSAEELALVYSGSITSWSDRLLVSRNPWLAGCTRTIKLAVRSEDSGTTTIFKDYLAKRLPTMRPYVEPQFNTSWPQAANIVCKGYGDAGVGACVGSRGGAIGYMDSRAARNAGLRVAQIDNASGEFGVPSVAGCIAAANSAPLPADSSGDWSNASLSNPPQGYALCYLSFTIVWSSYADAYGKINTDPVLVRHLRDFLTVALSDKVQTKIPQYRYMPLPPRVLAISRDGVNTMTFCANCPE